MIQLKQSEFRVPDLERPTEKLFHFYLNYDKPCGELALGENCVKIISQDKSNSLGMFLGIQRDITLKCHVTASFMLKCRNQFHAKSCCLSDREKKVWFCWLLKLLCKPAPVQRKCVIVWFRHDVDRYMMSCLSAVSPKIVCARQEYFYVGVKLSWSYLVERISRLRQIRSRSSFSEL